MPSETDLTGGDWLLGLIRELVDREYESALERVQKLYEAHPGINGDEAANLIIRDAAFWAAVVGLGMGAVEALPGIGNAIAVGAVLPEIAYLTKLQVSTALQIAVVYNHNIDKDKVFHLVLAALAYSYAFDALKEIVKQFSSQLTRQLIETVVTQMATAVGQKVAEAIGLRFLKQGLLKRVPLVAVPINVVMNYSGLEVFGRVAKKYVSPSYRRCLNCGSIQATAPVSAPNVDPPWAAPIKALNPRRCYRFRHRFTRANLRTRRAALGPNCKSS